ncbi:MAG: ADP-forming succinate--CoA ligase subunit beta [Alphaproteobacteria bacterium]|nr:ADP-forming succinate--CoA ligase subunit beta [Alphaproteobacteria bacterium]
MKIHEYQAKSVLRDFSVPVLEGFPARSVEEAVDVAARLPGPVWVVKAQIHAGGRGKGGGIKVVHSLDELRSVSEKMLGMTLVTPQTGPSGRLIQCLYIEDGVLIERELYLACLIDRSCSRVAFMASTEGGMDIEEVASGTPEKVLTVHIDPATGFQPFYGRRIAHALRLEGREIAQCVDLVASLYRCFTESDATLLEINPLVLTREKRLLCLDAKMQFDSNALYRHSSLISLRDLSEEEPAEVEASAHDLNYIKLEGRIGCMVNGAGLAMATMDIIKLYGEEPANFLDVGGSATKEKVTEALRIIMADENVKAILVNIFGGIMRCDIISSGILAAAEDLEIKVPVIVRLEGTNVKEGKAILDHSSFSVISAIDLDDAAKKAVRAVGGFI